MSTRRVGMTAWEWDKTHGVEYGPNGFRLCRLCKTETTYKRATLCSEACRTRWAILTNPSYARQLVYQRDEGVCALCELNTDMLMAMLRNPGHEFARLPYQGRPNSHFNRRYYWRDHPLLDRMLGRSSLWDMDHTVPVVEGGGECDLDNLRTLCLWCHKQVTAELAARRARKNSIERFNAKRIVVNERDGTQLTLIEVS